jgi:hypothetical protein
VGTRGLLFFASGDSGGEDDGASLLESRRLREIRCPWPGGRMFCRVDSWRGAREEDEGGVGDESVVGMGE